VGASEAEYRTLPLGAFPQINRKSITSDSTKRVSLGVRQLGGCLKTNEIALFD
jgi:hypothetical protein